MSKQPTVNQHQGNRDQTEQQQKMTREQMLAKLPPIPPGSGVHYEPISNDILKTLQRTGHPMESIPELLDDSTRNAPIIPPIGTPVEQELTQPIGTPVEQELTQPIGTPVEQELMQPIGDTALLANPLLNKQIEGFAQNERNGSLYYESLSGIAGKEGHKAILNEISKNCKNFSSAYGELFKSFDKNGAEPEIKETEIQKINGFEEGVIFALKEETRALKDLSELFEEIPLSDQKSAKKCQSILYKKISDLNRLQLLLWV